MNIFIVIVLIIIALIVVVVMRGQTQQKRTSQPPAGEATETHSPQEPEGMTNRPLLKQFGDLKPSDFEQHPVWVNCHVIDYDASWYEETDEETFRPWDGALPVDPAETMFLVSASFTLADGAEYAGFLTPQVPSGEPDLGTMQPCLFTPSGEQITFWFGSVEVPAAHISHVYAALGKSAAAIFPLAFQARPDLAHGVCSGTIPGFCRYGQHHDLIVRT